jgi:hypothetical protein
MKQQQKGYGWCEKTVSLFFVLMVLFLFVGNVPASESSYVDSLLSSARQEKLYDDPYWHILLHYKKTISGARSLIDDPKFFLSEYGNTNPAAELEATIRAFFWNDDGKSKHPICRFIARWTWLKEQLNIDVSKLPLSGCRRFDEIIGQMKPESVSLIFPTSHMNNPASMFGHTLLTIDTADESKLLSYAISYAAHTTERFGPLFAFKGVWGFYRGYFSTLPYYAKLQEYSDVNYRDIWEYPLNLTKDEVLKLTMHAYELDDIYSDYYFFDENCSYQIFFLLDAARPSLHLTDQCKPWVIPLDTVKVAERNGLIKRTVYRPSKTTKVNYMASFLSESDQKMALSISNGDVAPGLFIKEPLPVDKKINICNLASEYLQYLYTNEELSKEVYAHRFLETLRARSSFGEHGEDYCKIPVPVPPEQGHHSNKTGIGYGMRRSDGFAEVRYRAAYHDLLDDGGGYTDGAQIIFSGISARYYPIEGKLILQNFDLIDIVSLTPRDIFFKPISWKVTTGLAREVMDDGQDHMIYRVNPGGGLCWKTKILGLTYLMMETDADLGNRLEKGYAAGFGGAIGFIKDLTPYWKIHLSVKNIYYGLGDRHNAFEISFLQNFTITTNASLRLEILRSRKHGFDQMEAAIFGSIFF